MPGSLGARGKRKSPGITSEERLICRSMRCAAGLAPRNLLFPTWLPGTAGYVTPEVIACQTLMSRCSRNMRSSSLSNIESSALRACMEHGGIDRGAVDVGKGAGPTEGPARSKTKAHPAEAGGSGVGAERTLGTQIAGALAGAGRRWVAAWVAWTSLESQDAGSRETASGGTLPPEKAGQVVA